MAWHPSGKENVLQEKKASHISCSVYLEKNINLVLLLVEPHSTCFPYLLKNNLKLWTDLNIFASSLGNIWNLSLVWFLFKPYSDLINFFRNDWQCSLFGFDFLSSTSTESFIATHWYNFLILTTIYCFKYPASEEWEVVGDRRISFCICRHAGFIGGSVADARRRGRSQRKWPRKDVRLLPSGGTRFSLHLLFNEAIVFSTILRWAYRSVLLGFLVIWLNLSRSSLVLSISIHFKPYFVWQNCLCSIDFWLDFLAISVKTEFRCAGQECGLGRHHWYGPSFAQRQQWRPAASRGNLGHQGDPFSNSFLCPDLLRV